MVWARVDDSLWGSPKWIATPPRARALWVTALSWCMDQLTDGYVPAYLLHTFAARHTDADALVRTGLWKPAAGGWEFHDWSDYQPSKEQVLAERAAASERQRRAREKAKSRRDSRVSHTSSHGPPDPTRPDPTHGGANAPPTTAEHGEFQNVAAVLQAHGVAAAEARAYIAHLKAGGVRSPAGLISKAHRDHTLDDLLDEWRLVRDTPPERTPTRADENLAVVQSIEAKYAERKELGP